MKNILNSLGIMLFMAVIFTACKKEENKVFFKGGTEPVLTASSTQDLILLRDNADNAAVLFSWTNPDYKITTGISSQDVTYILQIDTAGKNFTSGNLQETSIAKDLKKVLTVKELNSILIRLLLKDGQVYNVEFRIKAALVNGTAVPLYSNTIKIKVTPYFDVAVIPPGTPPNYPDGELFIIGDATVGGWPNPVPELTQKFTRVSITKYKIEVQLNGGKEFLLLPKNGSWDKKYGNACGSNSCNAATGGAFKAQGDNFKGPAATGKYIIEVNFVTGTFTVVPK